MLKFTVSMAAVFLAVSCASSGTRPAADANQTARNRSVITKAEIQATSARDAYHVVQLLRPDWLRSRGVTSVGDTRPLSVIVYVDGQRYGEAMSLEQFLMGTFTEIRYYSGSDATSRWGTGHGGGVIYLTTR